MKKSILALSTLAAVAILPLAFAAALACEGPDVIYSDDFSTADPVWGKSNGTKIENGKLTITAGANKTYQLQNQSGFFEDMDYCADVVQHTDDANNSDGGLMFWGADSNNYYLFLVSITGSGKVVRLQNNRWVTPLGWTANDAIKTKNTDVNSLRVVTKGNQATFYVNGKEFGKLKGLPPQGGGLIGLFGEAGPKAPVDFDFTNLKITSLK
ncbi:hypothetical protein BH10PSE9_BH10PSE9_00030 [soil metagenome]